MGGKLFHEDLRSLDLRNNYLTNANLGSLNSPESNLINTKIYIYGIF